MIALHDTINTKAKANRHDAIGIWTRRNEIESLALNQLDRHSVMYEMASYCCMRIQTPSLNKIETFPGKEIYTISERFHKIRCWVVMESETEPPKDLHT